jgi:hypothetical protein
MAFTTMALLGISALGTYMQVRAQKKAGAAAKAAGEAAGAASTAAGVHAQESAESQAGLSDYNAQVADLQAQDALDRGTVAEDQYRVGVRGMIGKQRADIAGGNIDVGSGSAVDVQHDAAFLGELDALTIRTNAAREAWGFKVQSQDLRTRAAITRKEGAYAAETGATEGATQVASGNAANSAAKWAMAGTLVGAGGSLLAQRYGFSKSGA